MVFQRPYLVGIGRGTAVCDVLPHLSARALPHAFGRAPLPARRLSLSGALQARQWLTVLLYWRAYLYGLGLAGAPCGQSSQLGHAFGGMRGGMGISAGLQQQREHVFRDVRLLSAPDSSAGQYRTPVAQYASFRCSARGHQLRVLPYPFSASDRVCVDIRQAGVLPHYLLSGLGHATVLCRADRAEPFESSLPGTSGAAFFEKT